MKKTEQPIFPVLEREMEARGVTATVRRSLGGDIDASCGQLRRKAMEEEGKR